MGLFFLVPVFATFFFCLTEDDFGLVLTAFFFEVLLAVFFTGAIIGFLLEVSTLNLATVSFVAIESLTESSGVAGLLLQAKRAIQATAQANFLFMVQF